MSDPVRLSSLDAFSMTIAAGAATIDDAGIQVELGFPLAAPGPGGYVLTSDGTSWVAAPAPGGTVPAPGAAGNFLISDGVGWTTRPPVIGDIVGLNAELALKAPITSPLFLGDPRGPTSPPLTNDNHLATNAYVDAAVAVEAGVRASAIAAEAGARVAADALLAPLASPTFSGIVQVPTAPPGTNDQRAASTAFAMSAASAAVAGYATQAYADAAALAAKPAAIVARTLADLPAPVGGVITLPIGVTFLVGDVPLAPGQPPVFLAFGVQIEVPPGATLACSAAAGCILYGSSLNGLVLTTGGSIENLIIANAGGGPDVDHQAGTENAFRFLFLVGGGLRLSASGAQLELVSCSSFTYVLSGQYIGINLINCNAINISSVANWTGFAVEATAVVQTALLWAGGVVRGGFDPANARGIVVAPGASVTTSSITGCVFTGFGGAGSSPLVGISPDTTTTLITEGCLGIPESAPRIQVTLDQITAGTPPTTTITVANTWYPLNCTGATVTLASLMDAPTPGQIRMLSAFGKRRLVLANLTLDRLGGGTVAVSVRLSYSLDNGATWTPAAVQGMELKNVASPITITAVLELPVLALVRVEVTSATVGLQVQTRAVGLSAS